MKISGVIGIIILILIVIFIATKIISSQQDGTALNNENNLYKWIEFIILSMILILTIIFYSGFIKIGHVFHNNKLKITSIFLVLLVLLLLGFLFYNSIFKSNSSSDSQIDFKVSGSLTNDLSGSIYLMNIFYSVGILFIVIHLLFYLSLIDVYFESNIKFSRITGTIGTISLALIVFLIMGVVINIVMSMIENLIGSFGGATNSTSNASLIFVFIYLFIISALCLTTFISMSLTLFAADKKYKEGNKLNNIPVPSQTLKPFNQTLQKAPNLNEENKNNTSANSPGFELPKIVEREKKN